MQSTTDFHEELPLLPVKRQELKQDDTTTDTDDKSKGGYSISVAICFALNYSIGAGILGLPYEFYNAGLVLSSLMILFIGILTYITDIYIVDGILRAESITTLCKSLSIHGISSKYDLISKSQFIKRELMENSDITTSQNIQENYMINRNEYQLSELIGIFCGKWWRLAYDISFGISTLIVLWSYNVLFGVSLTRNIGIPLISSPCNMENNDDATTECRALYSLWVLIFWIWTLIITLIDFNHQKWLQVLATFARVFIIILMIITSIGLIYSNWYYNGDNYIYDETYMFSSSVTVWSWTGIAYMIAVSSFAFGNQFCIPDVIRPLSVTDKQEKQHILWALSIGLCSIVYILCGVSISLYFEGNTQSPCTLAWGGFMGFTYSETQPIWALIISWFIILLPAIDIGSAFPLVATTLANTFEAILLGVISSKNKKEQEELLGGNEINNECLRTCYRQKYVVLIKIILCTLVSGLALIEWNFELILAFSGAFKLLAVYIGPCILQWKSKQFMNEICGENNDDDISKTSITKQWIAHYIWLVIIITISIIAFIAVFVYTIQQYV